MMHHRIHVASADRPDCDPSKLDPARTALTVGMLSGLVHFSWLVLVAMGMAQPFLDLIFRLHFVAPAYHAGVFDTATGFMLIAFSTIGGALFGLVFALLWNGLAPARR